MSASFLWYFWYFCGLYVSPVDSLWETTLNFPSPLSVNKQTYSQTHTSILYTANHRTPRIPNTLSAQTHTYSSLVLLCGVWVLLSLVVMTFINELDEGVSLGSLQILFLCAVTEQPSTPADHEATLTDTEYLVCLIPVICRVIVLHTT